MMKLTTLSPWIRIALVFTMAAYACIITIVSTSPSAHASSNIDIAQCHDGQYSQLVASTADTNSDGATTFVSLFYCPAYQSVYARVGYGADGPYQVWDGTCSVKGANGQWRGGCTDGIPLGGSVDTQVTQSDPGEAWSACWVSIDGWRACTPYTSVPPSGSEQNGSSQSATGGETSN